MILISQEQSISKQQPMGNQSIAIDPPYFQQIFIGLARNDTALISGEFLVPRASQTHPYSFDEAPDALTQASARGRDNQSIEDLTF